MGIYPLLDEQLRKISPNLYSLASSCCFLNYAKTFKFGASPCLNFLLKSGNDESYPEILGYVYSMKSFSYVFRCSTKVSRFTVRYLINFGLTFFSQISHQENNNNNSLCTKGQRILNYVFIRLCGLEGKEIQQNKLL